MPLIDLCNGAGQMVEGRHEQLLEQQGIYASLWRVQSGLR